MASQLSDRSPSGPAAAAGAMGNSSAAAALTPVPFEAMCTALREVITQYEHDHLPLLFQHPAASDSPTDPQVAITDAGTAAESRGRVAAGVFLEAERPALDSVTGGKSGTPYADYLSRPAVSGDAANIAALRSAVMKLLGSDNVVALEESRRGLAQELLRKDAATAALHRKAARQELVVGALRADALRRECDRPSAMGHEFIDAVKRDVTDAKAAHRADVAQLQTKAARREERLEDRHRHHIATKEREIVQLQLQLRQMARREQQLRGPTGHRPLMEALDPSLLSTAGDTFITTSAAVGQTPMIGRSSPMATGPGPNQDERLAAKGLELEYMRSALDERAEAAKEAEDQAAALRQKMEQYRVAHQRRKKKNSAAHGQQKTPAAHRKTVGPGEAIDPPFGDERSADDDVSLRALPDIAPFAESGTPSGQDFSMSMAMTDEGGSTRDLVITEEVAVQTEPQRFGSVPFDSPQEPGEFRVAEGAFGSYHGSSAHQSRRPSMAEHALELAKAKEEVAKLRASRASQSFVAAVAAGEFGAAVQSEYSRNPSAFVSARTSLAEDTLRATIPEGLRSGKGDHLNEWTPSGAPALTGAADSGSGKGSRNSQDDADAARSATAGGRKSPVFVTEGGGDLTRPSSLRSPRAGGASDAAAPQRSPLRQRSVVVLDAATGGGTTTAVAAGSGASIKLTVESVESQTTDLATGPAAGPSAVPAVEIVDAHGRRSVSPMRAGPRDTRHGGPPRTDSGLTVEFCEARGATGPADAASNAPSTGGRSHGSVVSADPLATIKGLLSEADGVRDDTTPVRDRAASRDVSPLSSRRGTRHSSTGGSAVLALRDELTAAKSELSAEKVLRREAEAQIKKLKEQLRALAAQLRSKATPSPAASPLRRYLPASNAASPQRGSSVTALGDDELARSGFRLDPDAADDLRRSVPEPVPLHGQIRVTGDGGDLCLMSPTRGAGSPRSGAGAASVERSPGRARGFVGGAVPVGPAGGVAPGTVLVTDPSQLQAMAGVAGRSVSAAVKVPQPPPGARPTSTSPDSGAVAPRPGLSRSASPAAADLDPTAAAAFVDSAAAAAAGEGTYRTSSGARVTAEQVLAAARRPMVGGAVDVVIRVPTSGVMPADLEGAHAPDGAVRMAGAGFRRPLSARGSDGQRSASRSRERPRPASARTGTNRVDGMSVTGHASTPRRRGSAPQAGAGAQGASEDARGFTAGTRQQLPAQDGQDPLEYYAVAAAVRSGAARAGHGGRERSGSQRATAPRPRQPKAVRRPQGTLLEDPRRHRAQRQVDGQSLVNVKVAAYEDRPSSPTCVTEAQDDFARAVANSAQ